MNNVKEDKENKIKNKIKETKEVLQLRFHQYLFVLITNFLIATGVLDILWGAKCRSGKSYTLGGLISSQFKLKKNLKKNLNVLVVTPAPTETISQFEEDLFNKFADFEDFNIIVIASNKDIKNLVLKENNIIIISKQLLQNYINKKAILKIKNLKLDIICFDENHFSGTTSLSKQIFNTYAISNITVKIYLTATYMKTVSELNVPQKGQLFWDLEDEKLCKNILNNNNNYNYNLKDLKKLKERHGFEHVNLALSYFFNLNYSLEDIFRSYGNMPDLHLMTNMLDDNKFNLIKENLNLNNNNLGFSFTTLFSLNESKNNFLFKSDVIEFLRYIAGGDLEEEENLEEENLDLKINIFTRIYKMCIKNNSRTPFTQLWFLPSDNINEISLCLKKLMQKDVILKNYDILLVNRKNKCLAKDIKEDITKSELKAIENKKKGLIILAGNMLTLGITLSLCDIVMLLHDSMSVDKILQQMFRCMTEVNKDKDKKKYGFVVDLNINRVLHTLVSYNLKSVHKDTLMQIKYIVENNLINIDSDLMNNKDVNVTVIIENLVKLWKTDPVNSFKSLLSKLDNDFVSFNKKIQKAINANFTQKLNKDNINIKTNMYEDGQELPSGHSETKEDKDKNKEKVKIIKEVAISFTKDVLPYVIPLVCILTLSDDNLDFRIMLSEIKKDKTLLEVFNDQCFIWWKKRNLLDIIIIISNSIVEEQIMNINNISVQFKTSMKSLIDNPKELLELITECLKPKELEKKQFGEVFTPMFLVNEMLDTLPKEVWLNKNLKWFDPAAGMGNFPIAIYLKLMVTLDKVILDKALRKKHILENMLYMSELNKKNIIIIKQIFDINNKYKLNIYEGDSLLLDVSKTFKVDNFDIIVGNPPYQEKKEGFKKTNPLWHLFVIKSLKILKKDGYLVMIHPCGWRSPCGKFREIYDLIIERELLYLSLNDFNKGKKVFGVATNFDFYCLKNSIDDIDNLTTVKDVDSNISKLNLKKLSFIPNGMFDVYSKLIATQKEHKVNVLHDYSSYETRKSWMSDTQTKTYKYPCCYTITLNAGLNKFYSSLNTNGHFNVPKVMWSNGLGTYPIVDKTGKYGLTQFSYGIIDDKKNLENIKEAMSSPSFVKLFKYCKFTDNKYDYKVISMFKKDFYKQFLKENIIKKILDDQLVVIKSL